MNAAELGNIKLDLDLANTPEKLAAWAQKYGHELIQELDDWIRGEGSNAEECP